MATHRTALVVGLLAATSHCNLAFPIDDLASGTGSSSATTSGSGGAGPTATSGMTASRASATATGSSSASASNGDATSASSGEGGGGGGPSIPTDELVLYLDATDLPVGDRLTTWIDRSGSANDATQTDVDLKPHVIDQDGLAAVDFDGENDNLRLPAGFADFTTGYTAHVVARMDVVGTCVQILQMSNGQEIDDIGLWTVNGFGYEVGDLWVEGNVAPAPMGISVVFSVRQDAQGNVTVKQNGVDVAQGVIPVPANLPRMLNYVGGGLYSGCTQMAGTLQEILVWRRPLDEGEMQQVNDLLVAKWNVL